MISPVYKTFIGLLLVITGILTIAALVLGLDEHEPLVMFAVLAVTLAGILTAIKIHLREALTVVIAQHALMLLLLAGQTFRIKEIEPGSVFIIDPPQLELFVTGIGYWIISGVCAFNRQKFAFLIYFLLLVSAFALHLTTQDTGEFFMGHSYSIVGALWWSWIAYLFFAANSVLWLLRYNRPPSSGK